MWCSTIAVTVRLTRAVRRAVAQRRIRLRVSYGTRAGERSARTVRVTTTSVR